MSNAPKIEADKELDEILAKYSDITNQVVAAAILGELKPLKLPNGENLKQVLLAWRDKAVVAELERLLLSVKCDRFGCTVNHGIKTSWIKDRLSKLKAIMEIKES